MTEILVHDKTFVPFISAQKIQSRIEELGKKLNDEFENKLPLFIVILNGSFMFASDVFKTLKVASEVSFIKLVSYEGTTSTGNVVKSIGLDENLKGRHVVILEDIVDTGRTLYEFLPELQERQPASLKIVSLLSKPDALKFPLDLYWVGFEIPNDFIVGYGMDYNGLGRNIPEIFVLKP